MMVSVDHNGIECVALESGPLRVLVTRSVGPRILSLEADGSGNLFAELPDHKLDYPGEGDFHLYGGHRLWVAPEDPTTTYRPDDDPVVITSVEDGLNVVQSADPETGLQKSLRIRILESRVDIDHTVTNLGTQPVECAPWAITQMAPGGSGYLPLPTGIADGSPFLPNRSLVLWHYTDVDSPYLELSNDQVRIDTGAVEAPLKIGAPNPVGWLAYWREGTIFAKWAAYDAQAAYFDLGASSQCFANQDFLELETLGPRVNLAPQAAVTHGESWQIVTDVPRPMNRADLEKVLGV